MYIMKRSDKISALAELEKLYFDALHFRRWRVVVLRYSRPHVLPYMGRSHGNMGWSWYVPNWLG
jgi:hypothetical protein